MSLVFVGSQVIEGDPRDLERNPGSQEYDAAFLRQERLVADQERLGAC